MNCRICQGSRLIPTGLTTCEDWQGLGQYEVYHCSDCSNYVTEPMLRSEDDFKIPADLKSKELSSGQQALLRFFMRERVRRIRALIPASVVRPKLLDVGGGACAFANAAARSGFEVAVLEPNPANAAFAATQDGVRFLPRMLDESLVRDQVVAPGSLDAVTMWHSFEHVPYPSDVLRHARTLLKAEGILYLSVPNMGGFQAKFGQNYWTYLDVPHHLSHFTSRGLSQLMAKAGFEEVTRFRYSLEYDVFGWFQTLLNVVSRSHNYFYNRTKKGRTGDAGIRHPRWNRTVTAMAPLFLPLAGIFFVVSLLIGSPSCLEAAYRPVNRA